jgi:lysyl-tRNA synthetase class 2
LRQRALIIDWVRAFFRQRGVLEVETPLLCAAGAVDAHLDPIPARGAAGGRRTLYLMTSPEHSMKRLLAAGSGPIYQITRAFRDGERGGLHNPEFTILEWYRPGWDHHALMDEVEQLVGGVLAAFGAGGAGAAPGPVPFHRITYRDAFQSALGIDPHHASLDELARAARRAGAPKPESPPQDRDGWLDLLLVSGVQKTIGFDRPAFVLDFPASQAASARIRDDDPLVAERFELYVRGVELANGYHELLDPREQRRRYTAANRARRAMGKRSLPIDHHLLAALLAGVPASSGVAVGLDRVIMVAVGASRIDEVIAFPIERA